MLARFWSRRQFVAALACLLLALAPLRAADAPAKVYVLLWFDTEDYILPASDDAALRIAKFLTSEKVPATFKIVGEKARTLERRRRTDVIEALKKHEIGYHSNWHSVHPTPAAYLSTLGWDDGVAEFDRREKPGFDDVKRIFGTTPTCYGQPGSSWGPQSFGALRNWGVGIFLDGGSHLSVDDKPHYYGGILTLYKLAHVMRSSLGGNKDLAIAQEKFLDARKKLLAEGGGIVSIYYHPCEFVHKEFWDGANFRAGANPPRDQWKLPATKTEEESRIAFQVLEDYVQFMKRFSDVQFITASQAAKLYRDQAIDKKWTTAELKKISQTTHEEVGFQKYGDYSLAASEVLALLNKYVHERSSGKEIASIDWQGTPYGPSDPVTPLTEPVKVEGEQFLRTVADVADFLKKQNRVPTTVWLGSTGVAPESYLRTLAEVASELADGKPMPKTVELKPTKFTASAYVSADDPKLWGWVIFPRGFRAPTMMELAKRQAWTIKPAHLSADK